MTDLKIDVIPAMKVVLARIRDSHDHHTSMIVADAFLDLLHLLEDSEVDIARAKQLIAAGRL